VRHLAWLSATLTPPPEATPAKHQSRKANAQQQQPTTRRQKLLAEGASIELPPLDAGGYLVGYLFDVGPGISNGMGYGPVPYSEILAWQQATGIELTAWEGGMLRSLSCAYCNELAAAADPAMAAPATRELETDEQADERRARVSSGIAGQLRMLQSTKPKRR